ncbi:MAG: DUF5615 family PIN-like protein [Cyanobacteria bacterium J06648_11]
MTQLRCRSRTAIAFGSIVKLLFDRNLSPRSVTRLADIFPNSCHIYPLGMGEAEGRIVWVYAREVEL